MVRDRTIRYGEDANQNQLPRVESYVSVIIKLRITILDCKTRVYAETVSLLLKVFTFFSLPQQEHPLILPVILYSLSPSVFLTMLLCRTLVPSSYPIDFNNTCIQDLVDIPWSGLICIPVPSGREVWFLMSLLSCSNNRC